MTPEEIQNLRRLDNEATGGRWWFDNFMYIFTDAFPKKGDQVVYQIEDDPNLQSAGTLGMVRGHGAKLPEEINAELICTMRNTLPAMLDTIERQAAELASTREEIDRMRRGVSVIPPLCEAILTPDPDTDKLSR